jgi:hypothetical protein
MVALLAPALAAANSFCVGTSAELQDALTQASDGGMYDGEDNFILLQSATFRTGSATGNGPFHYHGSSVRHIDIFGGYDANCSTHTFDASLSVLDGQHATQVLNVRSALGPIEVYFLTIQNGESTSSGAGASFNSIAGDNAQVAIVDTIIRNNHSSASAGGIFAAVGTGNFFDLEASLIVGNSADEGNGAGSLLANGNAATVAGNTVTQNTTSLANSTGGLRFSASNPSCNCGFVNNILWNNSNIGLYLATANVNLSYNDYGTLGGSAPASSNGNLSVAPRFVDAAAGDFHLAGNSPLLEASSEVFGTWDIEGHARPGIGSRADMGVYYETIFSYGFDD